MRSEGRLKRTVLVLVTAAIVVTVISLGVASAQDNGSITRDSESTAQEESTTRTPSTTQDTTTESVTAARKKKKGTRTLVFTNPMPVSFAGPGTGVAQPYPSTVSVSGFPRGSRVVDVNLTFNSFSSLNPDDVAVMLAKGQRNQGVMADAGGSNDINDFTFTLDDEAPAPLPDSGSLLFCNSTCQPARYGADWPFPAPKALSVFDGIDPNGAWELFIVDDGFGSDSFLLRQGYSLTIEAKLPRR